MLLSQGLRGLRFLDVSVLDLPGHGTEFFEVVLSAHNHFVGRTADRDNSQFSKHYDGCSVVAVRRRGKVDATNPAAVSAGLSVSHHAMDMSRRSIASSMHPKPGAMRIPEHISDDNMEGGVLSPLPAFKTSSGRELSSSGCAESVSSNGRRGSGRQASSSGSAETLPASDRSVTPSPVAKARPSVPLYIPPPMEFPAREEKEEDVTESPFQAGDTVLLLAKENFMEKHGATKDFLLVAKVGSVPKPVKTFDYVPLLVFVGMLVWVLLGADMVSKRPKPFGKPSTLLLRCKTCSPVDAPARRTSQWRLASLRSVHAAGSCFFTRTKPHPCS